MKIILNGKDTEIKENMSIEELEESLKIPVKAIVAEINGKIAADFSLKLKEGDVLELIRLVGGG